MIIQVENKLTKENLSDVIDNINLYASSLTEVDTQKGKYLVVKPKKDIDLRLIGNLDGVKDVHVVSDDYQLVSKKWKVSPSEIILKNGHVISQDTFTLMAGPCSIEDEKQVIEVVKHLKETGVKIMRGGVYKPRSSPYSFRGLGNEGLKMWSEIARDAGIMIITEVMREVQVEEMYNYVDIFQVGARNTQNYNLLDALGQVDKPVLIKRGISGTIDELLHSAEYILSGGNEDLILCERGIRTFERASRNTLDINAVPILKEKTHLPIFVDPSHAIGIRKHVEDVALASIMAGADGIIFEIHPEPNKAASDGQQSLYFEQSKELIRKSNLVAEMRKNF